MQDETERKKELAAQKMAAEMKWELERKDQFRQAFADKREENVKSLENSRIAALTGFNNSPGGQEMGSPRDRKKFRDDIVKEVKSKEALGEAADKKRFVEAEIKAGKRAEDLIKEVEERQRINELQHALKQKLDWPDQAGKYKELKQIQALQTAADLMQEVEERQRLNALQQGKGKGLGQG